MNHPGVQKNRFISFTWIFVITGRSDAPFAMFPGLSKTPLFPLFVALAAVHPLVAQAGEDLRLVDRDDAPIVRATVTVVGWPATAVTDGDGRFRLAPAPAPPFGLVIFGPDGALLGTAQVTALVTSADRELRLIPADTVQVVSGVAPTTLSSPAAASTLISREEQERTRPLRLVETLEAIPGAENVGSGQSAVPALRGLARGRTLILIDDARVTAERRAGPSATYLNPFALETVEIVRGPGTVAYGADAIGGVIHARTPLPRTDASSARFEVAAGVGEPFASGAVEANVDLGSSALLAQVHQRSFGDYDSPEGEVDNSSARDRGVLLRGLLPLGTETRLLLGLQVDQGRDIARPATDTDSRRTVYPEEDSERFTAALDLPGGGGFSTIEVRAFFGRYRLVTERRTLDPSRPRIDRADVESDDASLRVVARHPTPRGYFRVGLDVVSRFGLEATNEQLYDPPGEPATPVNANRTIESARRIAGGLFVEAEHGFSGGGVMLAGGLRGDSVDTRNRGGFFGDRTTEQSAVSGYAAVRWRPLDRFAASLQVARGFRDPSLSDRYFRGVTARGVITGNPDLEPETSRQVDLALRGTLGRLTLALYGYLYRIEDLIERFEVAEDEFAFRNRGEQELRGLELEADWVFSEKLSTRLTFGTARGEILDDGSDPDDVPATALTASLIHRPTPRVWWQARLVAVDRDDRPGPNEKVTPSWVILDASAGVRLGRVFELRLLLGNITDRAYPASTDDRAPLAPGRSAALSLTGRF
jgi:outer membrane receptor protein involved in Fe transport